MGRRMRSKVGERRQRGRREEEEAGEMGTRCKEGGGKERGEADGGGWASPVAHNHETPRNPI